MDALSGRAKSFPRCRRLSRRPTIIMCAGRGVLACSSASPNEQEDFRGILRRFLTARSPSTEVRKLMATDAGWDRDNWKKLNQELGLTAVHIPEEYGGQGFGCVELGIVLEEMGRALLCAPYFSSVVLGATAILNAGTDAQKRKLLPSIATGDTIATLAFTEDNGAVGLVRRDDDRQRQQAERHEELRRRRPHRRPDRGAGAPGRAPPATTACRSSPCAAMRRA